MKKRSTLALISAMAVVAVGIFISFFLSFSVTDDSYVITLPGQGSAIIDTSPDVSVNNRNKLKTVSVTADNIQSVVSSLHRPENYQCQMEMVYYYQTQQTTMVSNLWKKGDLVRISQHTADHKDGQQILLTSDWAYLWAGDQPFARFPRQVNDLDLYSRAPSYEDLVQMSRDQILFGELRELDGQLCLYAETSDKLTGELESWYILVENGLLIYASGSLDGVNTYRCTMVELQTELAEDADFTLPDGTIPQ